MFILGAK